MYSFFVLLIPLSVYLYQNIAKDKWRKNINDFNDLKNSVKSVHPSYNIIRLYYQTMKLVFYKYKEEFLQHQFGIVKMINGNMCVHYYKNHTLYGIIVKNNEKKKRNILVFDQNEKDVTEDIKKYMGFNNDFHNSKLTPKDLGYNKLLFYVKSGDQENEYIFEDDEIINYNE